MANLPQYVLDNNALPELGRALQGVALRLLQHGEAKETGEGSEQTWICSDEQGQLFSFTSLEVNDKNVFDLTVGQACLLVGPREKTAPKRTAKEISAGLERFEQALLTLGAQRISRSGRG